ncbi:MAG: M3 family metallopeptidase [Bacteroidales bacterium]|nr:M3 family metallopeptidase [Bacteroidales bacterium]
MKKFYGLVLIVAMGLWSCQQKTEINDSTTQNDSLMNNSLLKEWNTPYGTPPFSEIKVTDYVPAFKEAIRQQEEAINAIVSNTEPANFDNTILALENSGMLIERISNVFFNLSGAVNSDEMQKVAEEITPLITKVMDDVMMNQALFEKIKAVHDNATSLNLDDEQKKVLEEHYKDFVRGGALLNAEDQEALRKVNAEIADLQLKFKKNVLDETNAFQLVIEDKTELAGLPESAIEAAAMTAKEMGKEGQWIFTLQYPSIWPFMQNADNRALREKLHKAYINRGDNNNESDNKTIVAQIANLRVKKANLLGFKNFASYVLDNNMAKTPDKVYELLDKLMAAALPVAKNEASALQEVIDQSGEKFKLEHWDWWYYTNKLKQQKYALDDEVLRPYFKLENVRNGAFDVANKLYGITFTEVNNIDKYHEDVTVFEVKDADGSLIGILYQDWFPRTSKRSGAWMTAFRKEYKEDGKRIIPLISMVCNFSKPTETAPSLLTFEEVETLFHEFGHALHGLLANTTYYSLTGTSVPRDFVELPSQIMENWAAEPEVIKSFAKHYQTGEVIPDELLEKMDKAGKFNQGFVTVEYLAAALLDMDWHTLNEVSEINTNEFEKSSLDKMGLIPEIIVRYRSTYFSHIWGGGYSAGYYGYIWAAILDSDAFATFKMNGLFDKQTATSFRENILSKGGTRDAMEMFVNFKGQEPSIEPLLEKRGLK